MKKAFLILVSVLGLCAAFTESAPGLGFAIVDHDALATARGDAFTATADNPSAIYYNPAGISQLEGTQFRIGSYFVAPESTFTPLGSTRDYSNDWRITPVPNFYFTSNPNGGPISLGLAVNLPFGFSIEYPDNTPFRDLIIEGGITYLRFNPVLSVQVTKSLSIAAGPTINWSQADLKRGVFSVGDEFKFKGRGLAVGATFGILWQPWEQHSFGLTYRSPTKVHYHGTSYLRTNDMTVATPFGPFVVPGISLDENADASIQFPQSIAIGYSFRPTPSWNIEANVEWTDWDSLNDVILVQTTLPDTVLPFNYQSSFYYKIGATYYCPGGFNVSAGYLFAGNSVPNADYTPAVPDSNHHVFSAGIGQKWKNIEWNLAYQFTFGPDHRVINGTSADGTYEFMSNAISLSFGYRF